MPVKPNSSKLNEFIKAFDLAVAEKKAPGELYQIFYKATFNPSYNDIDADFLNNAVYHIFTVRPDALTMDDKSQILKGFSHKYVIKSDATVMEYLLKKAIDLQDIKTIKSIFEFFAPELGVDIFGNLLDKLNEKQRLFFLQNCHGIVAKNLHTLFKRSTSSYRSMHPNDHGTNKEDRQLNYIADFLLVKYFENHDVNAQHTIIESLYKILAYQSGNNHEELFTRWNQLCIQATKGLFKSSGMIGDTKMLPLFNKAATNKNMAKQQIKNFATELWGAIIRESKTPPTKHLDFLIGIIRDRNLSPASFERFKIMPAKEPVPFSEAEHIAKQLVNAMALATDAELNNLCKIIFYINADKEKLAEFPNLLMAEISRKDANFKLAFAKAMSESLDAVTIIDFLVDFLASTPSKLNIDTKITDIIKILIKTPGTADLIKKALSPMIINEYLNTYPAIEQILYKILFIILCKAIPTISHESIQEITKSNDYVTLALMARPQLIDEHQNFASATMSIFYDLSSLLDTDFVKNVPEAAANLLLCAIAGMEKVDRENFLSNCTGNSYSEVVRKLAPKLERERVSDIAIALATMARTFKNLDTAFQTKGIVANVDTSNQTEDIASVDIYSQTEDIVKKSSPLDTIKENSGQVSHILDTLSQNCVVSKKTARPN